MNTLQVREEKVMACIVSPQAGGREKVKESWA